MRWFTHASHWVVCGTLSVASQFAVPAWAAPTRTAAPDHMKLRKYPLLVATLVMIFTPALNVSAQSDPVSVLEQFIGARNQADEPGAMALVADDIRYVGGSACPLANPCIGPQALRAEVHLFISDHSRSILIGSALVSGTTVTARAETSNDAVRAAGQDRVVYVYTVDVHDGKLTSVHGVQDASDAQTAAFQAFQGCVVPGARGSVGRSPHVGPGPGHVVPGAAASHERAAADTACGGPLVPGTVVGRKRSGPVGPGPGHLVRRQIMSSAQSS
jgi:hypothetical protein